MVYKLLMILFTKIDMMLDIQVATSIELVLLAYLLALMNRPLDLIAFSH